MPTTMNADRYTFEREADDRRLSRAAAEPDLGVLLARIRADGAHSPQLRELLLPMVQVVHLNIEWYERAVRREQRWRRGYLAGSAALIVAIPACVYCLSRNGTSATAVTAVLTGLFGLHKALSSALNQRRVVGNFWNAAAALKRRLYAFEDAWRGKATASEGPTPAFAQAVKDEIQAAGTIRDEEERRFFDQFSYPAFDLGRVLNSAGSRAAAVTARHRAPEAQARAATKATIKRTQTELAGLEELVSKRQQQLSETQDDDEAKHLHTSLHSLEQRQQLLELVLLKEEALLAEV